jgi:hypothetical protein
MIVILGGDAAMQATMLMVSILLYACSISSSVQIFGMYWIIINFVYASCWGAVSKIVRQKFHRKEWAGCRLWILYSLLSLIFFYTYAFLTSLYRV